MKKTSKAQTLISLKGGISKFDIPDFLSVTVKEYQSSSSSVLALIQKQFGEVMLVIRSSASDEDGAEQSNAGAYDSVLNVDSTDAEQIRRALDTVVASYKPNKRNATEDEIIVQIMLCDTTMSGVIFTHDLNTGAPYFVINYDDVSGLTNTVTGGDGEYANRTLYIHRGATGSLRSERFNTLLDAVQELEQVMNSQFLDIEFALGAGLKPFLLQVRAITTQPNWNRAVTRRIDQALAGITRFVRERFRPCAGVFGERSVLGQMPDWNPAEMIGRAPRALSFSLYRRLITDSAWRQARQLMGYAIPDGQPLMVSLAGQPFIDTRLSFHSYLPADLPDVIAMSLVNAWTDKLRAHPELHDKIEFDVAITTFSFDLDDKLDRLVADALTPQQRVQFRESVKAMTLPLLRGEGPGSIPSALASIQRLSERTMPEVDGSAMGLNKLIEDCIQFGTVPFAVLARHGFIARTILLSLAERGIFSECDVARFQSSVKTIAGDLVDDMRKLQAGEGDYSWFMERYGHLRPGTYDVLSPRYDQMQDFSVGQTTPPPKMDAAPAPFQLGPSQRDALEGLLRSEQLDGVSANTLLDYCADAIAGREYGKFVFTRSVSAILEIIAGFGEQHGLSREEMSHIPIEYILESTICSAEQSIEERLRTISEAEAERHVLTTAIRLPQVLFDEAGVHVIPFQVSQPNFITAKQTSAEVVLLGTHDAMVSLDGKIVLIENADPGFDWIFSQRIAGLMTKYGGANSHMAIRCAEFGIPAAIGCGEQRFEAFSHASRITLDCAAGLIRPLH
ncbi:PEP-utilizing enzyme [Denitromonas ohlonensis]|uniref:Pyruvate phosphate dikinase n=2 Tax=Denitromonas TaxID=139331 RepID=A0A557R538_9RHOO|nr:PEP-utilizing enzyme [Denitromonas ohlonensis]TVO60270.1 pyruvate phosphate dikinase [Denitromonas ohlonensis]TVO75751.1 pyruvate phosphate dikinase [Denitromonas ohlonensis]